MSEVKEGSKEGEGEGETATGTGHTSPLTAKKFDMILTYLVIEEYVCAGFAFGSLQSG